MSDTSIIGEIHALIDDKIASGVIVKVDWLAHEIMGMKSDIEGEDAPFYRVCAFKEICRIATRAIGKYNVEDTTEETLLLPGFRHLCKAYPINRPNGVELVPVNVCSDDELTARALLLEEMAKGCRAHAREIREYIIARRAEAAA